MALPSLNTPNGAPEWMRTFVVTLNAVLRGVALPQGPVTLPSYVAGSSATDPTRTLPPASKTPSAQVWASDINRIAVSNGSNWIRQDTGASI